MSKQAEAATGRQVHIERVIRAPRERVFAAWVDGQALARWYAPQGCRVTFRVIDARTGGRYHSCIHTPDGHECWCVGEYLAVEAPMRIVQTMAVGNANGDMISPQAAGMDPEWPAVTELTVTFEDHADGTLLTLKQTVDEALAMKTGAHPSWLQMLDRLDGLLEAESTTTDREIVVTRLIDAPRALVFEAWTDVRHLSKWWGPDGFTTTTSEIRFEPGGKWVYMMHGPDGRDYPNWIRYREIVPNEYIAYDHGGEDKNGPDEKPDVLFEGSATFTDEDGKTRVTMRSVLPTKEARDHVVREYGAIEGAEQTISHLDAYVQQLKQVATAS